MTEPNAPTAQRRIRVTNIYVTPWHLADSANDGELPDYLRLWRFERYYRLSADQLPKVLYREMPARSVSGAGSWPTG